MPSNMGNSCSSICWSTSTCEKTEKKKSTVIIHVFATWGTVVIPWSHRGKTKDYRGNAKHCRGKTVVCHPPKTSQNLKKKQFKLFFSDYDYLFIVCVKVSRNGIYTACLG